MAGSIANSIAGGSLACVARGLVARGSWLMPKRGSWQAVVPGGKSGKKGDWIVGLLDCWIVGW